MTLYRKQFEHDSCGFGLIANLNNHPSHWLIKTSIQSLNNLSHRGAIAADGLSGDGCGLLFKKPDVFLRKIAKQNNIKVAILKARSPSCGSQQIYDGTFSNKLIDGMGVTAALLTQNGIKVFNENQIDLALDTAENI